MGTQLLAAKPTPAKPTLAQRCELKTLSGLIRHIGSKGCSLQVDRSNFVPAYVTRLETRTDVLNARFAINAYHRKNEPPQLPRSDEPSTARFDEAWGLPSRASVHGFVKVGSVWFMVLEGASMPNSASWPLGAGMYPTNLKPEVHHHRSKWSSFHCMGTEPARDWHCLDRIRTRGIQLLPIHPRRARDHRAMRVKGRRLACTAESNARARAQSGTAHIKRSG